MAYLVHVRTALEQQYIIVIVFLLHTSKIADPSLTTAGFRYRESMPAWFSFKPSQTKPYSNTSRENDKFYPIPCTVKQHCYPFPQTSLCRPLRVLNILLMEEK